LFLKLWFDAAQFGLEAQSVMALRMMKIAAGGQDAPRSAPEWCWRNSTQWGRQLPPEHSPWPEGKAWMRPRKLR
jgi:hypothetical protein